MRERMVGTYAEAETFLAEVPKFTAKNPMEETREFYRYIQDCDGGSFSEKMLGKIIHVAGTNGKGSVCAFLQQVCRESGYKTGMFTSPHLVTTRERFRVDNVVISEDMFVEAFNWLAEKIQEYRQKKPDYVPTYFERLFFMGIFVFAKAGVEVTILETGLGGRLDATNVVNAPAVTVITEIGLDHMAYLGDTVGQIAGEKAGIIKPGVPVVFADRKKEASRILCKKATECGCKYHIVSRNDYKINEIRKKSIDFSVASRYYEYCGFTVCTSALYQVENAAVAIRACEIMKNDCGFQKITKRSIQDGIRKMHWAGRMEEIIPGVYIDGAHNEDGIEAFVQSVNSMPYACLLVFSVMKDKQYDNMIKMLCRLSMVTDFVVTHIPGERGADLGELLRIFDRYTGKPVHRYEKIEDAIDFCMAMAAKGSQRVIYIVGSLYLAGFVEAYLEEKNDKF